MSKIRILSIDGGGIRGILPGVILCRLEEKLQKFSNNKSAKLADYFDFFAGTSTGGILTLSYLIPDQSGRPLLTAKQSVDLYLQRGKDIFDVNLWQKLSSGFGIADEKYDEQELEKALQDTFQEYWLSDLIKPCIISAYNVQQGRPHFFKQHKSNKNIYNFQLKDVARATSAAPTYFEAACIENQTGAAFPLVDGGLFANNPAMVAYSEVHNMEFQGMPTKPTAKDMMIVSIGTGSKSKSYEYKKVKNWGQLEWIKPVIDIMMCGSSVSTDYHLTQIFDGLEPTDKSAYYRLEPKVITADSAMDNASFKNLQRLEADALSYIANEAVDLKLTEIANRLIAKGG
ncbi:patatin-like phospholipase family protein [Psychroflexus tropicus]|uniref:patatin-like phospholipase family protein n=1 Tax=Psychroflexus tropicus TaxID=197345 RepID=UPI0003690767|nr:patatin-like phospholipase family protein [Psychroflexus tropicus]